MDNLKKKISEAPNSTLVAIAVGAGVSILFLRQLWKTILKKTNRFAYEKLKLMEKINQSRAVNQNIVYLNINEKKRLKGKFYDIDLNLMLKIQKKEESKTLETKDPFLPPFQPGMHIQDLGKHHRLVFNKFSIYENHVLVITKQFEPQTNKLNSNDFEQCVLVQGALQGIFYYNSGEFSGASQPHKHIQFLPKGSTDLPFIVLLNEWIKEANLAAMAIHQTEKLEFLHGLVVLPQGNQGDQQQIARDYTKAYNLLYNSLVKSPNISYNLVATQRFLLMVPRKKQKAFDEISVNSVGFAGSILIKTHKQFEFLSNILPSQILECVAFTNQKELDHKIASYKL